MRELIETIDAWQAEGAAFGRAVVVRTFGSAPRPAGAVLLAADDGRLSGSVSGGCVEGAAFEQIQAARRADRAWVIRYGISDEQAWDVGLACGGTIDVLVEPRVRAELIEAARNPGVCVAIPLPADSPTAVLGPATPGDGDLMPASIVVGPGGALSGSLGSAADDATLTAAALTALERGESSTLSVGARQVFLEAYPIRLRLVVVGAVEVARHLVRFARELGYETIVVDGRASFATPARFPEVDQLIVGWPDEAADQIRLGPADAVAVLTHDPKFDEPAIVEALRRGCRYVGAIGSRKTQAARRERLAQAGLGADVLGRLRGPIGLDLGGRAPAETALAVMAEIVAERRGGTGRPLRERAQT